MYSFSSLASSASRSTLLPGIRRLCVSCTASFYSVSNDSHVNPNYLRMIIIAPIVNCRPNYGNRAVLCPDTQGNLPGVLSLRPSTARQFHVSFPTWHTHSSSDKHRNCWNCGRDTNPERELFFCDCGVVQKPAVELTYFDLMQLNPTFDIDTKHLGDMFRETQMRLHPDKFSIKSKEEQVFAQEQSSLLNKAYNTLLKPLSRAIYMLSLQDIEISEQDNFSDPEFLMEIMEINEEISRARAAADVKEIEIKNDKRIAETVKLISELFQKNAFEDVKMATIKLRYYTTIQERIGEVKQSSIG